MKAPRLMLAGISSGSGKTLVTCGLLAAWKKAGYRVQAFKCGPDYIDPMFHRTVLETDSCNLDPWFLDHQALRKLLAFRCREKDVAVLEGVMGYYDGLGGTSDRASSYEVAAATDTPVVLVVPGRGMSKSLVPLIKGFVQYRPDSHIAGVILNRISKGMYPLLKQMVEEELAEANGGKGIRVLGYVPELTDPFLTGRHLGLVLPEEIPEVQMQMEKLGALLAETLDLPGLLALAQTAPEVEASVVERPMVEISAAKTPAAGTPVPKEDRVRQKREMSGKVEAHVRIGVARDEAFCFLYPENLQILESFGAELVYFSPLRDDTLPENIQGLLLCGGYPELHGKELENNIHMRQSIRERLLAGMPCLAECGGFLYLLDGLTDAEGKRWNMVGALAGEAVPKGKLVRFGYVEVTAREDTPFLPAGQALRAHEFHYWDTNDNGDMFQAVKASGKGHWPCMRQEQQILAGFPHLYYGSNPELAGNFVKGCFQWQERCAGKQVAECHRKMLTGMVGCVGAMVLEGQADESLEGQQTER